MAAAQFKEAQACSKSSVVCQAGVVGHSQCMCMYIECCKCIAVIVEQADILVHDAMAITTRTLPLTLTNSIGLPMTSALGASRHEQ